RLQRPGRAQRQLATGELARLADDTDDPETAYLKRHYKDELRAAFTSAIEQLGADERRILRYAVIEQLSIDEIARLEQVHRATAARHVTRARAELVEQTRRILRSRLRVDAQQLVSILHLIESQLDVSIQGLLLE